ncbi:MAG: YdcF family protein [Cyanobacteria bacterium P01_F01_bin.150]
MAIAFLLGGAYRYWRNLPAPDAVLVLGGAMEREQFAAEFAQRNPDLPIWVSSGSTREYAEWVFAEAGISDDRIHLDYRAVDTVTNFTTMVEEFKNLGFDSVYVITSDYHMRRAWWIGQIVFGSQGIHLKPVTIDRDRPPEPWRKTVRDGVRSVLWVTTGHTGTTLGQILESPDWTAPDDHARSRLDIPQ